MGEKRGRLQEIIKAIEELEQKLVQEQFFTAEEKFYDQVKDCEVRTRADNSFSWRKWRNVLSRSIVPLAKICNSFTRRWNGL